MNHRVGLAASLVRQQLRAIRLRLVERDDERAIACAATLADLELVARQVPTQALVAAASDVDLGSWLAGDVPLDDIERIARRMSELLVGCSQR